MRAFFGALWRGLDDLRKFLHLVLLLLIFGIVVGALRSTIPVLPEKAALVIRPQGQIVEQLTGDPFERALEKVQGSLRSETLLWDLTDAIDAARDDDRIQALVLDLDRFTGAGQPTMQELTASIDAFRASGKKVIAQGSVFLQAPYYIAAHADEIYLDPLGFVLIDGYDRYVMYYKDALDKLGVDMNVFRVGAYKSAVEPFTRSDMSPEDREESLAYLGAMWQGYQADVARARKLAPGDIAKYVDGLAGGIAAQKGDGAKLALEAKLITGIRTSIDVERELTELVGEDSDEESYRQVGVDDYLRVVNAEAKLRGDGKPLVGVIVVAGEMLDGDQPSGTVGGESTARLIREARLDEDVKALVLRIDSPGGSAWASELIRRELELTRQAGKPVIASMSSVAASGGYWIATGADEIWAAPSTVTGSIGIFGLFPEFSEPLRRLGIGVDGVATAPLAGALDPRRPLDPAAAEAMQLGIEHGYRRFLEVVAQARKMTVAEVDAVARGRVWTGEAASGLGLVDKLGSLDDAIAAAAARAGLAQHQVVWPAAGESLEQRVLRRLLRTGEDLGIDLAGRSAPAAPLAAAAADVERAARALLRWNDPRHHYLHCLCDAP